MTTSKTPEASIAAALSRDTNLFERVAPSTYCVRPAFRKDPEDAEEVLQAARERIRLFQSGFLDVEEAEKENEEGEEVERDEEYDSDGQDVEDADADADADVDTPIPKVRNALLLYGGCLSQGSIVRFKKQRVGPFLIFRSDYDVDLCFTFHRSQS